MSEQHTGVVKWFNNAKGFGFIEHSDGQDVFVHYSVIQTEGFKTLKDGEEVTYQLSEGDKGLHAMKVERKNEPKGASSEESEENAAMAPKISPAVSQTNLAVEMESAGAQDSSAISATTSGEEPTIEQVKSL